MQAKPLHFQPAPGGYTAAHRGVLTLDDGRTVFLKEATDEMTAAWLKPARRRAGDGGGPKRFFAARAGLPPLGVRLRALQRPQLRTALPRAAKALGFPKTVQKDGAASSAPTRLFPVPFRLPQN